MGYTLRAFVGRAEALNPLVGVVPQAVLVKLEQGFFLIPVMDELHDALNNFVQEESLLPFYFLTAHIETQILARIGNERVGYIEAEYFGGHGEQAAILWEDGRREFVAGPDYGAINSVLKRLGATIGSSHHDEFEAVGLTLNRHTENWLPAYCCYAPPGAGARL